MTTINTNNAALMASAHARVTEKNLVKSFERLSSGVRVNSAADDAAGLAVANRMHLQLRSMDKAIGNSANGVSLLQSALSGMDEINDIILRMRELSVRAASGIFGHSDRVNSQKEVEALLAEITRIADQTSFNSVKLLDGTYENFVRSGLSNEELVHINLGGMGILGSARGTKYADGRTLSILRERTSGIGNSQFNTALSSMAQGLSEILISNTSSAFGSSVFDTPQNTVGFNGNSVISLLAQVRATGTSVSDRLATDNGTGTSSIDVLPIALSTGTSAFDTPVNATATGTSTLLGSTLLTSVAATSGIAPGGASTFTTNSFNNGSFDSTVTPVTNADGSVSIPGWTIFREQVKLAPFDVADPTDTTRFIDGFATPTDSTANPPHPSPWDPRVSRGDDYAPSSASYNWAIESQSLRLFSNMTTDQGGDVVHGPYVISDDSVSLLAGDRVLFDWRARNGSDAFDVYAYLLEETTGVTQELLNVTGNGNTAWATQDVTVAAAGDYKYVFVAGTFDETFGRAAGASLYIDDITVISSAPPVPIDTTGAITLEAEEVILPGSSITIDIDDLTSLQTQVAADPGAPATPTFTLSGADASFVRFDAAGDLVLDGPLRFATKDQFIFDVEYLATTGVTHTETVTLNLTEALNASATLSVDEAQNVTIPRTLLPDMVAFANRDSYAGTFRFTGTGTATSASGDFSINSIGQITSNNAIEFDNASTVNLDVEYVASDGRIFNQDIILNINDTLTSTASVTAEQASEVRVGINQLTSSRAFGNKYDALGWNVTHDIITSFGDGAMFTADPATGNVRSTSPLLISNKPNYNFQLRTRVTNAGTTIDHIETVAVSLTESLQASSSITAQEADTVTINNTQMSSIDGFAARDLNRGSYRLQSTSGDHSFFSVNGNGDISSSVALEYDTRANFLSAMNMNPEYEFDVVYTASDGRVFTESVTLELTDTLTAQSNLTTEQSNQIIIEANTLSATAAFATNHRLSGNAGLFSIDPTSPHAAFFDIDQTGRVTANRQLLNAINPNVQFDVLFQSWNGKTHRETVRMQISESLQAAASVDVYEATDSISVGIGQLDSIEGFAARDLNRGTYSISGGADFLDFTVDSNTGTITSRDGVEFDTKDSFEVAIDYLASDGRVFTETVTLNIRDTFFGTSTLEAEQAHQVSVSINSLSALSTFAAKKASNGISGTYKLESTGPSWQLFNMDSSGNLTSRDTLREGQNHQIIVSFNASDGEKFFETVNLNITESLQATSTVAADEANSVRIDASQMKEIQAFANRDNRQGSFAIVKNGADYEKFSAMRDGSVMSNGALEFDNPADNVNNFDVAYYASDGRIFTQHIELSLGDTFSGTSTIVAEEANEVVFLLNDMSSLRDYVYKLNPGGPSGSFSIVKQGNDYQKFEVDEFGNVRSNQTLRKDEQEIYNFDIRYQPAIGETFTQSVNLYLTDTTYNKSLSELSVGEAETLIITEETLPAISAFAAADNYLGDYVIAASPNTPQDRELFDIDERGVLTSKAAFDYETDRHFYEFSVIYTASDGTSYQNFVELTLTNDKRDDDNLDLEGLNIETVQGAKIAGDLLDEALNRVTSSMAKVGAIQNRLEHNIDNLSMTEFLLGLSRGRIIDADMAMESSELAKNTILSNAANQMLSNAADSKRLMLQLLN